jgi:ABC-type bacteriocin/lantibiotic exporter with double-glycine peptidase domain
MPRSAALVIGFGLWGCATYQGTAHPVQARQVAQQSGWVRVDGVPVVLQSGARDCGAAALSAVLRFWGKDISPSDIRSRTHIAAAGLRAGELRDFTRRQGLGAFVFYGSLDDVLHELASGRPVIVGTAKPYSGHKHLTHYEVVVGFNRETKRMLTMDPARGWSENTLDGFMGEWRPTRHVTLVVATIASDEKLASHDAK